MLTLRRNLTPVKPDPADVETPPETWGPEWDDDRWTISDPGPDADDQLWAAREFNADDDCDEAAAIEAAALDAIERSLIPADLARAISADSILHRGADPDACICEPCVLHRTRHFAGE